MKYQTIGMKKFNGTFIRQWEDTEKGPEGRERLRMLFPFAVYGFVAVFILCDFGFRSSN